MSEMQFVGGVRVFKPNERAPAWVKADIVMEVGTLYAWWQEHGEDAKLRLQVRESRKGTYYACINTRNDGQEQRHEQAPQEQRAFVDTRREIAAKPPPRARDEANDDLGELPF